MPKVVGAKLAEARDQLASTPLSPNVVYKPAAPGQPVGVVVRTRSQGRRAGVRGRARQAGARRAEHGVIPKLVGLPVDSATEKLESLKLEPEVHGEGKIVAQRPKWGTALVPGSHGHAGRTGRLRKREPASP